MVDFPPLREKLHIQQFLGCANWLRGYLPAEYGHAAKVLGQWQKPGAEFPEGGLGAGATAGCKAFKAIKQMMQRHICLASFDEAAAADGSCPLEQIADASGIAVGGSVLQMTRDLSRVKVLMTHSKSLTPAQQNWPPLIQEAFAQLEVKRATRRTFGSIRTVCWTDHANLTRDRDRLLEACTRDLQGMSGRLRGRVRRARGRSPERSVATLCPTPRTVLRSRCPLQLRRRPL